MFRALDDNNVDIFPGQALPRTDYRCPICHGIVRLKSGPDRVAHFYHVPDQSPCPYREDEDYMSEWHIRMQGYFPLESRERVFRDSETGEVHRADVFLEESNTVIEFQKSHMTPEEYRARTAFHLKEGRRIVWIFDESRYNAPQGDLGKLRLDEKAGNAYEYPFNHLCFKWLYHRKCLPGKGDPLDIKLGNPLSNYAVLLFTGSEDADFLYKICDEQNEYDTIIVAAGAFPMSNNMDSDIFFRDMEYFIANSPWRGPVYHYRAERQFLIEQLTRRTTKPTQPSNPIGRQMAGPIPRKGPIRRRRRGRF